MTNKFKIGDKVKFIRSVDEHKVGQVKTINQIKSPSKLYDYGFEEGGYANEINLELVESKPTKNQRITVLEETVTKQGEEINELKMIVAQIRKPSAVVQESLTTATSSVEDIIEFEGAQYKKVDRLAREGDVVIIKKLSHNYSAYIKTQKPYLVLPDVMIADKDSDGHKGTFNVYAPEYGRTPETVDAYELIAEGKHDVPPNEWPTDYPFEKSPNQLRAEIIEKAKAFVDENGGDDYHFEIVEEERLVLAWKVDREAKEYKTIFKVAICHPNDVFNVDIGKAIALGRALGLDVSEFEQAVQPNEVVIGMGVRKIIGVKAGHQGEVTSVGTGDYADFELGCTIGEVWSYRDSDYLKIINDTNAIYGGVE